MVHYKLEITDFFSSDFELIAIHTSLEDYRLAFFLNKNIGVFLEKCEESVIQKLKKQEICFSKFIYEDPENQVDWILVENKQNIETITVASDLFREMHTATTVCLLPELKKVDYLLKIEGEYNAEMIASVLTQIKNSYNVQTAYSVPIKQIKSKNNLIF